ncbi:hypothetical protein HRED_01796 [Candidatus Haloredivivus sp. G17]|jgi:hypothetical protein|nr:hypothetical protein HRED_01796 [Candidatus Haloredivivus sp. G17]MBY6294328.1 hypothetical protein [Nanohaloarchaea archaeon H01]
MPKKDKVDRREFNRTTAAAAIGILTGTAGISGVAVNRLTRDENQQYGSTRRETVRGSYDRDEIEQLKACVDEDDMRGFGESIDELLNPDEGRTVTRFEYVHDSSGDPSNVGSSIRYELELEGTGETHELGWHKVENEVLQPFAEAKNYDGSLEEYAEENC